MKIIVIGLGNPILGDDGVGWRVVAELEKQLPPPRDFDLECLSLGGLSLMEHLIGYECAILIDSFVSAEEDAGSIFIRRLSDLRNYSAYHIASVHDTSLQKALELGRSLGAQLPEDVMVVGIATQRISDFSDELSPPVLNAVPQAAHIVLNMLKEHVTTL